MNHYYMLTLIVMLIVAIWTFIEYYPETLEVSQQVTMSITEYQTGGTLCTPNSFAMSARCQRLKRELKANQSAGLYSIGSN